MSPQRPPNEDEQKLIDLNQAFHEHRLRQPFKWTANLFLLVCLTGLIYLFISTLNESFGGWIFVGICLLGLWLYASIKSFYTNRKDSRAMLADIAALKKRGYFEVQIYNCHRALKLPDPEDMGDAHLLEIAPNQLLCWVDFDFSETGLMPNTRFEVYDGKTSAILGRRINVTGTRFQALSVPNEASWDAMDFICGHGETMAGTVDGVIERLRIKYTDQNT